jgi:Flp pilus assembly protein TadG
MQMFRRFKTDQRGATAMLFGFTALPLLGVVGAAVDYSRAANYHSRMQLAVDATALAIVREPASLNSREIQQKGEAYLSNALRADPSANVSSVSVTRDGKVVRVAAAATMDRSIMRVLGLQPMPITANSQATSGTQRLEVALVLDNTWSMSNSIGGTSKMDALQAQVLKTLDELRARATGPDSIKVSVVPFDTEVRLDASKFRNENWFKWADTGMRPSEWNGYVYDRNNDLARSDAAPGTTLDSLFPAPRDSECKGGSSGKMGCPADLDLPTIRPLTSIAEKSNYDQLSAVVKSMKPRGLTNIALGAVWGQATLSPTKPFTEGASAADESVKKVMLIVTDGDNTAHHVNGVIENSETLKKQKRYAEAAGVIERIDANTRAVCGAAKSANIEVFTIRLLAGNEDLLRSCASAPAADHYSNVQTTKDLGAAFKKFLDKITQTRITS